jgi:hypothetical protein
MQLVVGRLRRPVGIQISRRPGDRHLHIGADADRDHVLGERFTEADAGIEALCHDVHETIIDRQIDDEVRIEWQQLCQGGQQDALGRLVAGRDAQCPSRFIAQLGERCEFISDFVEAGTDTLQQSLARLGCRDASAGARQQAHAEPLFQLADRMAESRRRHTQFGGRTREAALARHCQKGHKIRHGFALHR